MPDLVEFPAGEVGEADWPRRRYVSLVPSHRSRQPAGGPETDEADRPRCVDVKVQDWQVIGPAPRDRPSTSQYVVALPGFTQWIRLTILSPTKGRTPRQNGSLFQ